MVSETDIVDESLVPGKNITHSFRMSQRDAKKPKLDMTSMQQAISAIRSGQTHYDVVIICTTDDHQAAYWMQLLQDSVQGTVLAVSEDWGAGGAGNGLGTLYAWQKAVKLASSKGMDLAKGLADGSHSAALYHTAGKGTRMAPLPASEMNNKPGVVSKWFRFEISCLLKSRVSHTPASFFAETPFSSHTIRWFHSTSFCSRSCLASDCNLRSQRALVGVLG